MAGESALLKLNIFHKILLTMLVVALLPFAGLWYITSSQSKADWNAKIDLTLTGTANAITTRVNGWVDMNLRALKQNAALDDMVSMDTAKQGPILNAMAKTYEWAYLVYTVRPDGQNVGRSDDESPQKFQYGDRQYVRQVLAGNPLGHQVVIAKTTNKPAFVLAGPIQGANRAPVGVIAMAMHLDEVSKTVTAVKIGETGFAILLDESNKVIAHGKPGTIKESLQDLGNHPALNNKESIQRPIVFTEGDKQIIAYTRKTQQGWTLIVQQEVNEAFAPLRAAQRNAFILLVISLVLLVVIAYLLSQRLASPIRRLTTEAENISRGKLDVAVTETTRGDEIGALARAIERMGVSIKMAFERLQAKA